MRSTKAISCMGIMGSLMILGMLCMAECRTPCDHKSCAACGGIQLTKKTVSIYFQDELNVTDFMVARPPNLPGDFTPINVPFGGLLFFKDVMTEGPDPASAHLGNITGTLFGASLYYGSDALMSFLLIFSADSSPSNAELKGLHGTLAVSAMISASNNQPQPILGGTGSFASALGSVTLVPIDLINTPQIFRVDLVLYWPPYCNFP